MKKSLTILAVALLTVPIIIIGIRMAGSADASAELAGRFESLETPQATETPGKVEIVDVFSYACPHCFSFLPVMEAYKQSKPDYVEVRHMPAIFNERWAAFARAFYTAQVLGIEERIHRPLFEAIHEKNRRLESADDFMAFFAEFGVSNDEFRNAWSSFGVDSLVRKSDVMQRRYGVRSTPTLIVNGKYRVTGTLAGSFESMILVADALAAEENAKAN